MRLARLDGLTGDAWGDITVETLKGWLADHEGDPGGICRHGANGWHSIAGFIAEPARGLFHVRRGHGLRKQTRDDAGERHVTKNRPHHPPDTASDVAASQSPGQRICSMTLPSFSISSP